MTKSKLQSVDGGRRSLEEAALLACFTADDETFERVLRQLKPAANVELHIVVSDKLERRREPSVVPKDSP